MSDAEEKHTQGLRMEAQAVEMGRLSLSQLSAAATITEKIHSAYNQKQPKRARDERRNQILMVSGDKGAGKTTLAMSLRRWYDPERNVKAEHDEGKLKEAGLTRGEEIQNYQQLGTRIGNSVRDLRDVHWLDVLSLDAMPPGTNLVAAIFARITEAAARQNDPNSPFRQDRGLLEPVSLFERALHELGSLRSDAVMALEGNLHLRNEGMDPESYAIAAIESEKKKLEISERLNNVLRRLIERATTRGESEVKGLFVLPVDDLDSSPSRAAEMLSLAYSLSIPRLIFLLMGSVDTLDQILFYQVQGQFRELLQTTGQVDQAALEKITSTANEIASNSLRKMIPPSQRISLEPLTLEHAARFIPEGRIKSGEKIFASEASTSLENYLEEIRINPNVFYTPPKKEAPTEAAQTHGSANAGNSSPNEYIAPTISLKDLLFTKDPFLSNSSDSRAEVRDSNHYIYDGLRLLESAPRQLADLHRLLIESRGHKNSSLIHRLFTDTFIPLVDEDGPLTPPVQDTLKECLKHDPLSGEVELTPPHLSMRTATGDRIELPVGPIGDKEVGMYPSCLVVGQRVRSLELWSTRPGEKPRLLSTPTRSTLKFVHDLIRFTGTGVVTKSIPHKDKGKLAFTRWNDGVNEPFDVPWLSTEWLTFWHTDFFFRVWNKGLVRLREVCRSKSEFEASDLPYPMAIIAAASLVTAASTRIPTNVSWISEDWAEQLNSLMGTGDWTLKALNQAASGIATVAEELASRAKVRRADKEEDDQTEQIHNTLVNLALLFAPECSIAWKRKGLPAIPTAIATFLEKNDYMRSYAVADVRRFRLKRLRTHASTLLGIAFLNPAVFMGRSATAQRIVDTSAVMDFFFEAPSHFGGPGPISSGLYCPTEQDLRQAFLQSERKGYTDQMHPSELGFIRSLFMSTVAEEPTTLLGERS